MIDCEKKRKVLKKEATDIASQLDVNYIETSSLEGSNIEKVSDVLCEVHDMCKPWSSHDNSCDIEEKQLLLLKVTMGKVDSNLKTGEEPLQCRF